jgi:phosphatidate cytidylyltransferase
MTGTRILTAAILIAVVVAAVWWGPLWLVAALVMLVTSLALHEFFGLAEKAGARGYLLWTSFASILLIYAQMLQVEREGMAHRLGTSVVWLRPMSDLQAALKLESVVILFVLGLAVMVMASRRPVSEALGAMGSSAAGMLLIALPVSYVVRLRGEENGVALLLFLLALIWVGDTLAYFVGRLVGRNPLAPELSPGKTLEGALANLAGAVVVGAVFTSWIAMTTVQMIVLAAAVSVAGQIGDLAESAYKRSAGVKDSGKLLPGHGGMLDRVDSLVFAAPVMWCYLEYVLRH